MLPQMVVLVTLWPGMAEFCFSTFLSSFYITGKSLIFANLSISLVNGDAENSSMSTLLVERDNLG
jgi:hypothetical protein